MERAETLLHKLQQQFQQKAPVGDLLLTVQLLQHELAHQARLQPTPNHYSQVAVALPLNPIPVVASADPFLEKEIVPVANVLEVPKPVEGTTSEPAPNEEEEKIIQVLQVDEAEIEAELEEIKRNAATMQQISVKSKPQLLFDMTEDEIPTLAQKPRVQEVIKEINEVVGQENQTLNETLKEQKTELSDKLIETSAIKDLKKAIGINDRYLYINELFRGDEAMYERSIKTINGFSSRPRPNTGLDVN